MSNPSIDYLADRNSRPGYGLLRVTDRTVKATLAGKHGSGLAKVYAEEIVNLQERLRFTVRRIARLEELVKAADELVETLERR